ncbi:hypothetical protein [Xanthomonas theicola]|uniref:hypothetical protein n=1 Tax=Xanthomonas theicola TaxID=56464 RepID=UPI001FEBB918|nr:hypothetical protein [Xanthomonas theicola]
MSLENRRFVRRLSLACVLGSVLAGGMIAAPAQARPRVGLSARTAPPPPRLERAVMRPGDVCTRGDWHCNDRRHVWVGGRYMVARPAYTSTSARAGNTAATATASATATGCTASRWRRPAAATPGAATMLRGDVTASTRFERVRAPSPPGGS